MSTVRVLDGSGVSSKTRIPATSLSRPVNTPFATVGSTELFDSSYARTGEAERQKELGDKLGYDVVRELWQSVFCDVPTLLETLFPVDEDILSHVFKSLKTKGIYQTRADPPQWTIYPTRPSNEASLHEPFVQLVEVITHCLRRLKKYKVDVNDLGWHILSSTPPATRDRYIPAIKPDIGAVWPVPEARIPWSRIVIPIEVKKSPTAYQGPAILQLLKYVRLIFRESHDRCFVFGIVLARSNMTVYLADRTGVVGSTVFDLHSEPERFLRVIVGLLTSTHDRLGYDTSMSLIKQQRVYETATRCRLSPQFSYEAEWDEAQDEHYWLLDMPKPKQGAGYGVMDESETETLVLYKGVSLRRGGVIRGRATRVWKAWLLAEMTLEPKQRRVFVVKDTWRDDERPLEGEFYKHMGRTDGIAVMRSFSIVRINGEDDTVAQRIRRGLYVKGRPRCIDLPQPEEGTHPTSLPATSPDRDRGNTTRYSSPRDYLPAHDTAEISPRSKTHSRVVMESYGWSIRYAKSLLELVGALIDVLEGYRAAYRKGIIHRDMSVENILINRLINAVKGNRGFIIDFDYAKLMEAATLHDDPASGTRPFMSGELLCDKPYIGGKVARPHSFYHDLESILWILLWICICKCGAGIRRPALVDRRHEDHENIADIVETLFEVDRVKQLGKNKKMIILYLHEFELCLPAIDEFYAPLKPLLRRLWEILNTGYLADHFDFESTMDEFITAFKDSEKELNANPPILTPDQKANVRAEEDRRANDESDWEHTPCPVVKPTSAVPVLEPLQALRLHPTIPEGSAGLSVDVDQDSSSPESRSNSPTPFANDVDSSNLVLGIRPRPVRNGNRNAQRPAIAPKTNVVPKAAPASNTTALKATAPKVAPAQKVAPVPKAAAPKAAVVRKPAVIQKPAAVLKPVPAPKKKAATAAPHMSRPPSDRILRSRSRTTARSDSVASGSSRVTTPPSSTSSQSTVQERSQSRASRGAHDNDNAGPSTDDHATGTQGRSGQRARGTGAGAKRGLSCDTTKATRWCVDAAVVALSAPYVILFT